MVEQRRHLAAEKRKATKTIALVSNAPRPEHAQWLTAGHLSWGGGVAKLEEERRRESHVISTLSRSVSCGA